MQHPDELLRCLLQIDEQYRRSLFKARAAGWQWGLVEPTTGVPVPPYPWMNQTLLSMRHPWMAFDQSTGLPNEFLTEQLLADDLGREIESNTKPRTISISRLSHLFASVLVSEHIDRSWLSSRQSETFFGLRSQFIAVTNNGAYELMVSKLDVLAEMIRPVDEKKKT
jgi:hypothetical protein